MSRDIFPGPEYPDRVSAGGRPVNAGRPFPCRYAERRYRLHRGADDPCAMFAAAGRALRRHGADRDTLPRLFAAAASLSSAIHDLEPTARERRLAVDLLRGRVVGSASLRERRMALVLSAAAASATGCRVHLLSASPRHAAWFSDMLAPVMASLDCEVGHVDATTEARARRRAYRAQITIATPREVALDHLRDRVQWPDRRGGAVLRLDQLSGPRSRSASLILPGLPWALVDRADRVLVDDAQVPVVVGAGTDEKPEEETLEAVYALTGDFEPGRDFDIDETRRSPRLRDAARERLARTLPHLADPFVAGVDVERLAVNALRVRHLLERGRHYQLRGRRVLITALLPGQQTLSAGDVAQVRRLLAYRESGAEVLGEDVVARATYLDVFRLYHRLAGTASSHAGLRRELKRHYGLRTARAGRAVVSVPVTHRCRAFAGREQAVNFIARRSAPGAGEPRCALVIAAGAADRDRVVELLHGAGVANAAALFDKSAARAGEAHVDVRVASMRELLPEAGDAALFSGYDQVDVFALCIPPSAHHARECAEPTRLGRRRGRCWQLVVNDPGEGTVPLAWMGRAAESPLLSPLLALLVRRELRRRARDAAAQRTRAVSRQAGIDDLLAFSGRGVP